jgi:hypothetical protein
MDVTDLAHTIREDDFRKFVLHTTKETLRRSLPEDVANRSVEKLYSAFTGNEFTGQEFRELQRTRREVADAWTQVARELDAAGEEYYKRNIADLFEAAVYAMTQPDIGNRLQVLLRLMPYVNVVEKYHTFSSTT